MNENRVVIYSNGIADFQRSYEVGADATTRIAIPVRQDHLADVLASFNVFGDVKLESPPTFRPSNELEGSISITPQTVLEDLATSLSGARVRVERAGGAIEGTLVGLHQEEEATAGEPIHPQSMVVLADDGFRRCVLREVQSLTFLDEDVQKEIDKALQRNYRRIKPNSTFVELELSADGEAAEAIVQYTIPAAAWKISYRLRMTEDQPTELQGFAIVDNNTDEDWSDFRISVVTGDPITFSTDLAESKSPRRKHVDLVSEMALGSVEVEAEMMLADAGPALEAEGEEPIARALAGGGTYRHSRLSKRSDLRAADMELAETHEVGDFSVFESESPVTIPAKRSAVIPVFQVQVADAKSVLHYKLQNHAERAYRSIEFTNQAAFSLGRGVCTVFEEGVYAGSCVIPSLKPGESRLLLHALETGVSVRRDQKRRQDKVVATRLSEGVAYTSTRQRQEIHYHVKNSRDEQFELVLDHDYALKRPDVEAQLLRDGTTGPLECASQLADGVRYSIVIGPKVALMVRVVERRIEESTLELVSTTKKQETLRAYWLKESIVKKNGPLARDKGILECVDVHREYEANRDAISEAVQETERLAERQERLRKNLSTGGQDDLTNRWRNELDKAEQAIRKLEEEQIPALRDTEKILLAKLREALQSLSAEWSAEPEGE